MIDKATQSDISVKFNYIPNNNNEIKTSKQQNRKTLIFLDINYVSMNWSPNNRLCSFKWCSPRYSCIFKCFSQLSYWFPIAHLVLLFPPHIWSYSLGSLFTATISVTCLMTYFLSFKIILLMELRTLNGVLGSWVEL